MVSTRDKSPARSGKKSSLPVKVAPKSPSRNTEKVEIPNRLTRKSGASPSRKSPSGKSSSRRSPPKKSPLRKSPSRKSPSRKSPQRKSPARKSPNRESPSFKSPTGVFLSGGRLTGRRGIGERKSPSRSKSAGRPSKFISEKQVAPKQVPFEIDSDSDNPDFSMKHINEKPKAAVRGRARKIETDQPFKGVVEVVPLSEHEVDNIGLIRRSARISQQREVERIVHVNQDFLNQKLSEFSDDDDIDLKLTQAEKTERFSKSRTPIVNLLERYEFGGTFGALMLMICIPVLVYAVNILCNESRCSYKNIKKLEELKQLSLYFDIKGWTVYFGFTLLLLVLSALPFGGKKVTGLLNKQGRLEYRMNGCFCAVVISLVTILLSCFGFSIVQTVTEKYFQMISASLVFGAVFSVVLFVKSYYVAVSALNPHAVTESHIYNFWMGRELNPRLFGIVDVKMYLLRYSIISSVIMNGIFLYKSLLPGGTMKELRFIKNLNIEPTPLVLATLEGVYLLDGLIFESTWLTSFEVQYEGVGWMLVMGHMMYPFMLTTLLKYVIQHNVHLSWHELVIAAFVFFVGYFLLRASNSQKDMFRKNPYHPYLLHLETIPTTQGKKLLVSGYWGLVRHPNYFGNILMILSFLLFVKGTPPAVFCIADLLFLVMRAKRDGARCKTRYGIAWDRYCQRVKYVLVPKIY